MKNRIQQNASDRTGRHYLLTDLSCVQDLSNKDVQNARGGKGNLYMVDTRSKGAVNLFVDEDHPHAHR